VLYIQCVYGLHLDFDAQSVNITEFCLLQVFTSIFTLECFLKILALSKEYFACGWNIFDLIIVSASLLDLSFELMDSLVVLRCLRLVSRNLKFFSIICFAIYYI
jgi:hypothetical protein